MANLVSSRLESGGRRPSNAPKMGMSSPSLMKSCSSFFLIRNFPTPLLAFCSRRWLGKRAKPLSADRAQSFYSPRSTRPTAAARTAPAVSAALVRDRWDQAGPWPSWPPWRGLPCGRVNGSHSGTSTPAGQEKCAPTVTIPTSNHPGRRSGRGVSSGRSGVAFRSRAFAQASSYANFISSIIFE